MAAFWCRKNSDRQDDVTRTVPWQGQKTRLPCDYCHEQGQKGHEDKHTKQNSFMIIIYLKKIKKKSTCLKKKVLINDLQQ